ncbi:MAG TPA: 30S ribosomal protein S6e [Thermoprotei archaeon]|nr:30S ribosomal protein S6e [Thermoprotei archaeon]
MPQFKIVVSDPKTGKAKTIKVEGAKAQAFIGLKIGDTIDGSIVGIPKTKLKITGGSGRTGEPMIPSLPGGVKRRILLSGPPGFHPNKKGLRRKKLVRGNTITEDVVQINTVIIYPGEENERKS